VSRRSGGTVVRRYSGSGKGMGALRMLVRAVKDCSNRAVPNQEPATGLSYRRTALPPYRRTHLPPYRHTAVPPFPNA
jgi:hypothetical protein